MSWSYPGPSVTYWLSPWWYLGLGTLSMRVPVHSSSPGVGSFTNGDVASELNSTWGTFLPQISQMNLLNVNWRSKKKKEGKVKVMETTWQDMINVQDNKQAKLKNKQKSIQVHTRGELISVNMRCFHSNLQIFSLSSFF